MSAPTTNIDKQRKWHRPALVGMALVVVLVGGLFVAYLGAQTADEPTAASALPDNVAADQ